MKHTEPHVIYIITKLELGGAQKVCLSLFDGYGNATLISGTEGPLVARVAGNPHVLLLKELTREVRFFGFVNEIKCLIKLTRILRALKKKYPYSIVHTHSTKAGLLGRWAAFFAGIKIRVHTVHGYAFHDHQGWITWMLIYLPELFTSFITTHFICVSSTDVKTGIRLFLGFSKKHSIIRAAVSIPTSHSMLRGASACTEEAPSALSLSKGSGRTVGGYSMQANRKIERTLFSVRPEVLEGHFIFGTIACFKPQKNLFDLLHAFKQVYKQNPQVRLELIGDGQLRPALEQWISEHKLEKVITLHGWQEHVAPIIMHWHAFVLTSLWEGLPCAVVEARLQKLPVISYQTGGIHDVITHGKNGLLYPQKEWQQLANGMLEMSRDHELYARLSEHQDDLDDFKVSSMVAEHKELYRQI